jgi:hypothetical protein
MGGRHGARPSGCGDLVDYLVSHPLERLALLPRGPESGPDKLTANPKGVKPGVSKEKSEILQ